MSAFPSSSLDTPVAGPKSHPESTLPLPDERVLSVTVQTKPHSRWDTTARIAPVIEFVLGDITNETTDAIVNPAGPGLVDLAIRRAAGPALLEAFHRASRRLPAGRLQPGKAILTSGFDLAPVQVIHCGPPFYADDPHGARVDLVSCHVEALSIARARGFASISFPSIATGNHRYPVEEAAEVAVGTVIAELRAHAAPALVRFVLFHPSTLETYFNAARSRLKKHS
jgi:O-acetyl-ADP-ribose deacetylase (regulator of RNase III)